MSMPWCRHGTGKAERGHSWWSCVWGHLCSRETRIFLGREVRLALLEPQD